MTYINGINEVANPLLIVVPIILMVISGYAVGRMVSQIRKVDSTALTDLTYGNIILNFIFISGFIVFGVITYSAKIYFSAFTYILIILSVVGGYFLLKSWINKYKKNHTWVFDGTNILIIFGVALFAALIVFQGIIIYYHPIFSEYDAIFFYLPTAKSILLGNGLNHDFYTGSDISIRTPPFPTAINAWLIHSFGYSSMRIFPVYFVFLTSLVVFRFARSVTKDSFIGLIASTAFLITPSILVVSSQYSLYDDIVFTLFLSSSFFFLSQIVSQAKPTKIYEMMLIISLSLAVLSKEVGLALALMIFFLVPAIKFTQGNLKLRVLFSTLSFLPLYLLTFYDLHQNGLTYVIGIRLITLSLANLAVCYIVSQIKNQEKFGVLLGNSKHLILLGFPLVFILLNVVTIGGPYPTLILIHNPQPFSDLYGGEQTSSFDASQSVNSHSSLRLNSDGQVSSFNTSQSVKNQSSLQSYRDLNKFQNLLTLDLTHALEKIPRVDILFIAVAVGPIFIFFKLRGFAILIRKLKTNSQYAVLLLSFISLLVMWWYFDLGFTTSQIRHIAYFVPLLSVIIAVGMNRKTIPYKIYYYGIIAYSLFYFLSNSVGAWHYNGIFGGFLIEPQIAPIMTLMDLVIVVTIISPLIILELREQKMRPLFMKYNLRKARSFVFIGLLILLGSQVYVLSSNMTFSSLEKTDKMPSDEWEGNVFDVIQYLKHSENGNIFSIGAPPLAFFTNRTNFDVYSPHTFASVLPLLQVKNSTLVKEKISEMNIRYFVIPNENSQFYRQVQNLASKSSLLDTLNNDDDFVVNNLASFDIYKFDKSTGINLIDKNHLWAIVNDAKIYKKNSTLNIVVKTDHTNKVYSGGIMQTQINLTNPLILIFLEYVSESHVGQATFYVEISDKYSGKYLWGQSLHNTYGELTKQTFALPNDVLKKQVAIKLFIITDGAGEHTLMLKKMRITHT